MKVLFLSNNDNTKILYKWLCERCDVYFWNKKIDIDFLEHIVPELIISYNYKFMIKDDIIERMKGNVVNLHISFLPWNRGSNPNFWSFVDGTPKGVTIHQISSRLDEGAIICQKELIFDVSSETFESTYAKLNEEIVKLFIENWEVIRDKRYLPQKQYGKGSYHNMKDFETMTARYPVSWNENIGEYLQRIK